MHGNTAHHASCPRTLPLRGDARAPRRRRLRSFARFGLQDAQTPPSPRVGEGDRGEEGANARGNAANRVSRPRTLPLRGDARAPRRWGNARRGWAGGWDACAPYKDRFFGGACVPSLVLGFRTPNLHLLPVWEKGVGGKRGNRAQESRKPLVELYP